MYINSYINIYSTNRLLFNGRNYIWDDGTYLRIGHNNKHVYINSGSANTYIYGRNIYLGATSGDYVHVRTLVPVVKVNTWGYAGPGDYRFAYPTSSIKYKTDLEPIEPETSAVIYELKPTWYRGSGIILENTSHPEWSYYGLIAEEVASVDPHLVNWGVDQGSESEEIVPINIDWDSVTPLLLDQLQRQKKRIDELERRIHGDNKRN